MDKQIVISIKTIILTLLILLGVYVVYRLGFIIGILLISTLVVISMEQPIKHFMKMILFNKRVSRGLAVLISYSLFILAILLTLTFVLPPLVIELQKMIVGLPAIISSIETPSEWGVSMVDVLPETSKISAGVLTATLSIFSNFAILISVLVISIYMSLDWENIKIGFISLFPKKIEDTVEETIIEIEKNVGSWIKGQLILMLVVGVASFIGLAILGVKYSVGLGLLSGIFEAIPNVGPVLSAVVAGLIGFTDSPIKGIGVVALFVVIQQLENNFLVPKIMGKISGFRPLVILLALLVGANFFGILGAICAVPMTMIISTILKKFLGYKE
ncbi:AI-2E family transporter [Patescibacteria group bacterium]|nr:AI-2E family transporter [Patescibacteria group bacterium]